MDNNAKQHDLVDLMGATMAKIREMVDVNTIIGEAITTPDGITIIPVSKLSFGFGSGGTDYGQTSKNIAGGGAAGVNITPVGFLINAGGNVKMLPIGVPADATADRIIEKIPDLIEKVEGYFENRKAKKQQETF